MKFQLFNTAAIVLKVFAAHGLVVKLEIGRLFWLRKLRAGHKGSTNVSKVQINVKVAVVSVLQRLDTAAASVLRFAAPLRN